MNQIILLSQQKKMKNSATKIGTIFTLVNSQHWIHFVSQNDSHRLALIEGALDKYSN